MRTTPCAVSVQPFDSIDLGAVMRYVRVLGVLWLAGIALQAQAQLTSGPVDLPRDPKTVSFTGEIPDLFVPATQAGRDPNSVAVVLPRFDVTL